MAWYQKWLLSLTVSLLRITDQTIFVLANVNDAFGCLHNWLKVSVLLHSGQVLGL